MKTIKILKFIIATIVIAGTLLVTNAVEVQAALQANPNTKYTKENTPVNWMKNFRQMETAGGAMGLNETLNADLTASSDSNNIDVHMMRTTEYGAIAILSASGYGNPSNDRAITSTTGNNTGIMLNTSGKWEWTAGGLENYIFSGTNSRYYDTYTESNTSVRVGDALGNATTPNPGCTNWHSASNSDWVNRMFPSLLRGNGGIFSFNGFYYDNSYYSRGVAVSGTGL